MSAPVGRPWCTAPAEAVEPVMEVEKGALLERQHALHKAEAAVAAAVQAAGWVRGTAAVGSAA